MTSPPATKAKTEAEKAEDLAELNANWDKRLTVLNEPCANLRARAFMKGPTRLNGRVRAGELGLDVLLTDAFGSLAERDRWFESPHPELAGLTPKGASRATKEGDLKVRALLASLIKHRRKA